MSDVNNVVESMESEVSYKPLIEDMTWSYSRVDSFDDCPYRWYLKYIHYPKLKDGKRFYSEFGTFMHKLLEAFYKGEITKEQAVTEFASGFNENTRGDGRPKFDIVKNYFKSGIQFLRELKPFRFETIAVEEKVEFEIAGHKFVGYIDYHGMENGEHVIVDNKSRNLKPRSGREVPTKKDEELDSMLKQLYIYAEAIRQKYGKLPKLLCFNCFKNGVFIEEPFNMEVYEKTLKWAEDKIKDIENTNEFYPNVDYFSCNFICGMSEHCCYYESTKSRKGK